MTFQHYRIYIFRIFLLLIIAFLIFELYIYLLIKRNERDSDSIRYVYNYESVLCSQKIVEPNYSDKTKSYCPVQGIVTSFKNGDLHDNMWQYANIIAASITTGLEAYVPACLKHTLEKIFDKLTLPLLSDISHCVVNFLNSVSNVDEWVEDKQSIVFTASDLYNDIVAKYMNVVRKHFEFNKVLTNIAQTYLLLAKGSRSNVTYIGVYITETNIVAKQEVDQMYPNVQFFIDAVNQYRKEYKNALFFMIVDRVSFWKSIFKTSDTYIIGEKSITYFGAAMSILSHCNHTILGSDGFAAWAAILAGGNTIVSLSLSQEFYSIIKQDDNWVHLVNVTKA